MNLRSVLIKWICNILQGIINRIESEEDKTLPEDYFKDIIIKLQQLPKRKMPEEERQKIWKLYQTCRALKPEFSCCMCKRVLMKEDLCKTCENHWTDFPLPLEQAESHCTVVDKKVGFGKMNEVVPYPCLQCPFNCYSRKKGL